MIWVGASGESLLKLIQEVAGSQHCAQVCPPDSWGSGIQGECKEQSKGLDDRTSEERQGGGALSQDSC